VYVSVCLCVCGVCVVYVSVCLCVCGVYMCVSVWCVYVCLYFSLSVCSGFKN